MNAHGREIRPLSPPLNSRKRRAPGDAEAAPDRCRPGDERRKRGYAPEQQLPPEQPLHDRDDRGRNPCTHGPAPERVDAVRPDRSLRACPDAGSASRAERRGVISCHAANSCPLSRGSGNDTAHQQPRAEAGIEEEGIFPDLPKPPGRWFVCALPHMRQPPGTSGTMLPNTRLPPIWKRTIPPHEATTRKTSILRLAGLSQPTIPWLFHRTFRALPHGMPMHSVISRTAPVLTPSTRSCTGRPG